MQRLRNLASQILEIYKESHEAFQSFQSQTGLTCQTGCGECCLGREVSASIIEMIPCALNLYDLGLADKVLQTLEKLNETDTCIFYTRHSPDGKQGNCSNYDYRPCICRSFGAATIRDKTGNKTLSICKLIKQQNSNRLKNIDASIAPVISEFSSKILFLEGCNPTQIRPINQALKDALLKVLTVATYTALQKTDSATDE